MNKTQTFKIVRLSAILLFILALVAIVMSSGKQLVITNRVEVPVYVSEVCEPSTSEILEENSSNIKPEAAGKLACIYFILFGIYFLGFIICCVRKEKETITDKKDFMIAFGVGSFAMLFTAILFAAVS